MILRLLLIILALWAGYAIIRYLKRLGQKPPVGGEPTRMVQCKVCGTHIPTDKAIHTAAGIYCSTDHLERDQQS